MTATIQTINYQNDQLTVSVFFSDSATGWSSIKVYSLPSTATQSDLTTLLTADGTSYKANLAKNAALQAKVGTVITI